MLMFYFIKKINQLNINKRLHIEIQLNLAKSRFLIEWNKL